MKIFFLSIAICWSILLHAQQKLVFSKTDSSTTVILKLKDLIKLSYNGYMQQQQEFEGMVTIITDSNITIAPRRKFLQSKNTAQTIFLKDITGFRKYSKFKPASEIIYAVIS
jgi:hypothetical protein